ERRVLILVENLPSPFDRRVWQGAGALRDARHGVSVLRPPRQGLGKGHRGVGGIPTLRAHPPRARGGAPGSLVGYRRAPPVSLILKFKVLFKRGFDAVHACNPPDLFFLIGGLYKLFGKKFVFDHHDANPELYEAKFGRRDAFYRLMLLLEKLTFRAADISLAT